MSTNILCEGTLYVETSVAGVAQGIEKLPGVAKLEIKVNSELKEATTKDKGQYGQISASVAIIKPSDLTVELSQATGKSLAMALQGDVAAMSQGSGTVTDEVITAKLGKFVQLSKRNIAAAGFVLTNSAGTTTYVEGTDYAVNHAMGLVEILSTGAITEAQSLKADFGYNAISGEKVKGGTVPQIKGKLMLDGKNLEDGKPLQVTVWEANITSDTAVDFMSDDFIKVSMKGRMVTPTGKTSPFEIDMNMAFS